MRNYVIYDTDDFRLNSSFKCILKVNFLNLKITWNLLVPNKILSFR